MAHLSFQLFPARKEVFYIVSMVPNPQILLVEAFMVSSCFIHHLAAWIQHVFWSDSTNNVLIASLEVSTSPAGKPWCLVDGIHITGFTIGIFFSQWTLDGISSWMLLISQESGDDQHTPFFDDRCQESLPLKEGNTPLETMVDGIFTSDHAIWAV